MVGSTRNRRRSRDRALALLATAVVGVGVLSAPSHGAAPGGPKPRAVGKYNGKAMSLDTSVAGAAWKPSPMKPPVPPKPLALTATTFPTAADADVAIAPPTAQSRTANTTASTLTQAPGTPVLVGAPTSETAARAAVAAAGVATATPGATAPPAKVTVTVGSHAAAVAAGVTGVVVSLARSDGQTGPASVSVGLDYSTFAQAFGGDLPDRLVLVAMPACALTTPKLAACRTQTPVKFVNDAAGRKLTADVTLPGPTTSSQPATSTASATEAPKASKAPTMVLAATTSASGPAGSYTATSLSASNGWGEGGDTGSFTYSYSISMPPGLGGAAPGVALAYDSGSVDGKTAVENAQPSWIGDGWDYSPGFIERTYAPCSKAQPTNFTTSTDNCFARDKNGNLLPALSLSFGAHGGQLVPVDSTNTSFALPTDDGTRVDVLYGQINNGTRTGEFYRIRSPDGTVAFFGAEILPDAAAITAAAGSTVPGSSGLVDGSAWIEPVFNDTPASGCQDPTKVTNPESASTNCMQAWRWNVDFVIDPHQNVTRYGYLAETNYYGFGTAKAPTWYVRGGVPNEIDYGWQLSDVQAGRQSAARVQFNTATRCVDPNNDSVYATGYGLGQAGCGSAAFDTVSSSSMVDTPVDQNCPSTGTSNNQCQTTSPTFWSSRRLASIVTQAVVNGSYQSVDHYDLFNQFHALDTPLSPMWLTAIRHCAASVVGGNGLCPAAGSGANQQTLPDVQFSAVKLVQRVPGVTGANVPPNLPGYQRERIAGIYDELGASTSVTYDDPTLNTSTGKSNYAPLGCTAPPTVAPDWHNTQLCYPEYWTAPGTSGPFTDWFHKYVVTGITTQDNTHAAGVPAPTVSTSYSYGSSTSSIYSAPGSNGAGAAWHSNDSELLTDPNSRTYDQYRGFAVVTATTGSATDAPGHPQTQTVTTYLRGMDQDPDKAAAAAGSCTSGTLTVAADCTPWNFTDDLSGVSTRDDNALAGTVFETQTVNMSPGDGKAYSTSANVPWMSTAIAQHARTSPLPTLRSFQLGVARSLTQVPLAAGGQQRTEVRYWHKQANGGAVVATDTLPPSVADGSSEVCTTTGFATAGAGVPWMTGYVNQAVTTAAPCAYSAPIYSGDPPAAQATGPVLAAVHNYFDNGPGFPTSVTHGDVTRIDAQVDTASPPTFQMRSTAGFDAYGRVLWSTDAAGSKTTSTYAPSTTLPTDVTVTAPAPLANGAGWVTKTHFDPTRALPLWATDPNGRTTYVTYDALGRTTAAWFPGRPYSPGGSNNPPPNSKFSYTVNGFAAGYVNNPVTSQTIAPSMTETDDLREDGSYAASISLVDSLGRTRQTQTVPTSDDAGRIVTDTSYDSVGRVAAISGPYYDSSSAPSGSAWVPASQSAIPRQVQKLYDGLGRTTDVVTVASAAELWRTHTDYPGADRADVTPPAGGVRTSTVTNARGKTTAVYTYHPGVAFGTLDAASADALTYTYDQQGDQTEVDQRASSTGQVNKWTFGYDMLGRKIAAGDPDAGNSSYRYDLDGNLQTLTVAIGSPVQKSLFYTYDLLNRRTGEYIGTDSSGPEQASWSYDNVPALTAAQKLANPGSDTAGNLGRLAGSIRYSSSGAHYTESVGGYDAVGNPLSTSVGIPAADNNGPLGGHTYTNVNHYTALGQLTSTDLPVGGDLQPDTIGFGYNTNGLLVGTSDSYADLLMDSAYSPYGEIQRRVLGDYPSQVVQDTVYDQATRRVTNSTISQLAWNAPLDTTAYTYDASGHITAAVDIQAKAASYNSTTHITATSLSTDAQCYHYDYAGRLDAAWSDTGAVNTTTITMANGQLQTTTVPLTGTGFGNVSYPGSATGGSGQANSATAATTGGLGVCANTAPTSGVSNPSWKIGGPEPYAKVFGYDSYTGNRTQETDFNTSGVASATANYSYNAPGSAQPHVLNTVSHSGSSTPDQYYYDAAGNTTSRAVAGQAVQNLAWDAENRLLGDNTAGYLYDADGNQLIRRDGSTTTLYLGATELHLTGSTVTGDRYFSNSGAPTIVETGSTTPHVSYEAGNLQDTASTTIDAAPATSDKAVTARRAYTPFNTPRGTGQPNVFGSFIDDHTFLGKTTDSSTGLVDMGARKYDPNTGRFISPDSVFQAVNPREISGYAYAGNDPVNASDPTGLDPGGMNCVTPDGRPVPCTTGSGPDASNSTCYSTLPGCPGYVAPESTDNIQLPTPNPSPTSTSNAPQANAQPAAQITPPPVVPGENPDLYGPGDGPLSLIYALTGLEDGVHCFRDGSLKGCAFTALNLLPVFGKAIGVSADAARAVAGVADAADAAGYTGKEIIEAVAAACRLNSFSGGTQVLMADGTTKPIADVEVGDEIENAQPGGQEEKHRVEKIYVTYTDSDFTDLTVTTPTGPKTITSTQQHPYYDVTTGEFTDAAQLKPGDRLQTDTSANVTVLTVRNYTSAMVTYNLTIDGVHTYYVEAGDTPVLVHNCPDLIADESRFPKLAHTLAEHVNPSRADLIRMLTQGDKPKSVNSVWDNVADAQQAVDQVIAKISLNGQKSTLSKWLSDASAPQTREFTGTLAGRGSLGNAYRLDSGGNLVSTATGNKFTVVIQKMPGHKGGYIVLTAFPQ